MRVGFVGGGEGALKAYLALRSEAEIGTIVGVVCAAESPVARHGLTRCDSVGELMRVCAPDAVYVATPVHTHLHIAREVVEHGGVVLLEKPMTTTVEEAERFAATEGPRTDRVFVALKKRYGAAIACLREAVWRAGVAHIQMEWRIVVRPNHWRQDVAASGGGVIADLGCHLFDLAELFGGRVKSIATTSAAPTTLFDAEREAECVLELESGTRAVVRLVWAEQGARDFRMLLQLRDGRTASLRRGDDGLQDEVEVDGIARSFEAATEYLNMFRNLGRVLAGASDALPGWTEGLHNVRLVETARRSLAEGGRALDVIR